MLWNLWPVDLITSVFSQSRRNSLEKLDIGHIFQLHLWKCNIKILL